MTNGNNGNNGNNNRGNNNAPPYRSESDAEKAERLLAYIRAKEKQIEVQEKEYKWGEKQLELDLKAQKAAETKLALDAKNYESVNSYLELLAKYNKKRAEGIEISDAEKQALIAQKDALEDADKALVDNIARQRDQVTQSQKNVKAAQDIKKAWGGVVDTMGELTGVNMSHLKSMKEIGKEAMSRARGLDEVNKALALQTGYTRHLQKDLAAFYQDSSRTGLMYKEQAQIFAGLSNEYKDFNALAKDARMETFDLARKFKVQGVEGALFGQTLDKINRGLGITGTAGLKAAASFEKIAMRTGRPLGAVLKDFNELEPQLARFGSHGVKVFTRLQEEARKLGMESKQIFDVAELFDTFESAAEAAGKLNAQFGTQFESVNMMHMDHADRFQALRAEFDRTGVVVANMGKRQLQMVGDILKVDPETAKRMFGDPMELRRIQKETAINQERQKGFLTAQKRMQVAYEKFYMTVEPLLVKLMDFFGTIAEYVDDIFSHKIGRAIGSVVVFTGILWKFTAPLKWIWKGLKGIGNIIKPLGTAMAWVGSKIGAVASFLAPLGRALGFFAKAIAGPVLLLKDLIGSTGLISDDNALLGKGTFMDMSQSNSQARLAAGATGAAIGGAMTGGTGAMFGYGMARSVPDIVGVNDAALAPGPINRTAGVKGRADDLRITDAQGRLLQLGTFGENRAGRGRESSGESNQTGPITVKELTLPITLEMAGTQMEFIEKALDVVLNPMVVRG